MAEPGADLKGHGWSLPFYVQVVAGYRAAQNAGLAVPASRSGLSLSVLLADTQGDDLRRCRASAVHALARDTPH